MNVCVIKGSSLQVPEHVIKEWVDHPIYGPKVAQLVSDVQATFGTEGTSPTKRLQDNPEEPKEKKAKQSPEAETIAKNSLQGQVLKEIALNNFRNIGHVLSVRAGHEMYIVNTSSDSTSSWQAGSTIAGFGKGEWKTKARVDGQVAAYDDTKEFLFTLESSNDNVMLGNVLKTLRQVVEEKRSTNPDVKICYHKINDTPQGSDPGAFGLDRSNDIFFVPSVSADSTPSVGQSAVARIVPIGSWTRGIAGLTWVVKWTAKGLMPIRPQIVSFRQLTVTPGHAVRV
jgi:hypothetical protein